MIIHRSSQDYGGAVVAIRLHSHTRLDVLDLVFVVHFINPE
jgi:hypothetical protein